MSGIENSVMPFVSTIGFGGIAGFLIGFALKRTLMYLESQHIVNVNWDKLQMISNSILSTITTTATTANATSTGIGMGPIQAILGTNTGAAAASILPITSTMEKSVR
jgi:uncharacterized membrane protein (Fun14 family)